MEISLAAFLHQMCRQMGQFRFLFINSDFYIWLTRRQHISPKHFIVIPAVELYSFINCNLNIRKQQQSILWRHLVSAAQNVFWHLRVYFMRSGVNHIVLVLDYSFHTEKSRMVFFFDCCFLQMFSLLFNAIFAWEQLIYLDIYGFIPFNILQTT